MSRWLRDILEVECLWAGEKQPARSQGSQHLWCGGDRVGQHRVCRLPRVKAVGRLAVRAPVVDAHDRLGAAPGGQAGPTLPGTWSSPAAPEIVSPSEETAG